MTLLETFRKLDLFTKVESRNQSSTTQGGLVSIIVSILIFLVCFYEFSDFYTYKEKYQFFVDEALVRDMAINFDITVNTDCKSLRFDIFDNTGSHNNIKANVKKESVSAYISNPGLRNANTDINKGLSTNKKGEDHIHDIINLSGRKKKEKKVPRHLANSPKTACRFYGTVVASKVKGSMYFSHVGSGIIKLMGGNISLPTYYFPNLTLAANFSHTIDELSFGPLYPSLVNPLDNTFQISQKGGEEFGYYVNIIPTIYTGIGGTTLPTNQYAVHQHFASEGPSHTLPGILFNYDIEPIRVEVTEVRIPFMKFLVRLCSMIGGIFVTTGLMLRIVDVLFSKTKNSNYQRVQTTQLLPEDFSYGNVKHHN
ncbi:hypothetical protein BB560_006763 [Smittium megazygosporum]|uniref:Endoplasmic reticulum vesicle transporter C-terminal domain-containing protein n=1 Tax=Smittium megazygosporum TaxID=133381 RepID=A0A2T9Y1V7_9FUNG|nr:hypothetical protein BB560_006763 [Smittium megazygosporum]